MFSELAETAELSEVGLGSCLGCLGGAAVGRRTSDLAVMCSIPGPGVIGHLNSAFHPFGEGKSSTSLYRLGVKAGCARLCRAASKIM